MTRKNLLFFLLLLVSSGIIAQARINAPGNYFFHELNKISDLNQPPKSFVQDYDLLYINDAYHIGILGMVDETSIDEGALANLGVINRTRAGNVWTFRVPLANAEAFTHVAGLRYLEIAEPVSPDLHEVLVSARADSVHLGLGGLSQAYRGEGVIVTVIDWGFDYTHPVFYDEQLGELRLSRAWDQNKIVGTPPDGYDFGVEYVGEELLIAKHDTDYVFGPGSHGTHVAGIAGGAGGGPDAEFAVAGGGGAARFIGGAPDSELIFISLRRDAPSFVDAINYVADYAESVNKPFVVNMSFGSHLGPHDGTDLKNVGMDNLHGPGRIFVGSAGNNGTGNFHLERNFNENPDTLITVVTIHQSSDWGQTLSMWGSANSSFSASIALANQNNQIIFETPFFASTDDNQIEEIYPLDNGELHIRVMATEAFTTNDKPNIRLEVRNTTTHKIILRAASDDSHLHIWSNARMQNRYTNWGSNLSSIFPGATGGNTEYAPGEPAGCGKNVITVGAYRAERVQSNGTVMYGNIANFSSRGPTVDERVKPDITAGGVSVWSAINSYADQGSNPIEFNGQTYEFSQFSGTSMSGPMVTGIVALMLSANPTLSAQSALEILRATARLDQHTGEIGAEGDLTWGWGKANALAAVLAAELATDVEFLEIVRDQMRVFPNPANDQLNIEIKAVNEPVMINIYDLSGRLRLTRQTMNGETLIRFTTSELEQGMYLIRADYGTTAEFAKVLIRR